MCVNGLVVVRAAQVKHEHRATFTWTDQVYRRNDVMAMFPGLKPRPGYNILSGDYGDAKDAIRTFADNGFYLERLLAEGLIQPNLDDLNVMS